MRLARGLITLWALLGGVLLLVVVLINVSSITGSAVFGKPFPGDFELTEVGVCVAVFSFLPYCQITGSNVSADIFTSRASPRALAVFSRVGALTALVFALVLLWRMWLGMLDQRLYGYTTTILQFPHWLAYVPILFSLGLLALAAVMSLVTPASTADQERSFG